MMTVRWLPGGADALTLTPSLILVKRGYEHDQPLLAHERTHQAQMRRDGLLAFWWRYLTSKSARLIYELEAHRVQLEHGGSIVAVAVSLASSRYGFGLTLAEASELLT